MNSVPMKLLSRSEEMVLLAVWTLQDEAYGVTIRHYLTKVTGGMWSVGAVYVPLERLARRGYVASRQSDPTPERGGRRKRYYRLTPRGVRILQEMWRIEQVLWEGFPRPALGPSSET